MEGLRGCRRGHEQCCNRALGVLEPASGGAGTGWAARFNQQRQMMGRHAARCM